MYKWCVKHAKLTILLFGIPIGIIFSLISEFFKLSTYSTYIFIFAYSFMFFGCIYLYPAILVNKAVKELKQHCDPYPLLYKTKKQLLYPFSKTHNQLLLINYCVALRETGNFEEVIKMLENINIDQYAGTQVITKFVYYNNLADAYLAIGNLEQGEIWHKKSMQIFNGLKLGLQKKLLSNMLFLNGATVLYLKKDYDGAMEIVKNAEQFVKNKKHAVDIAFSKAQILLAQGKHDEAKIQVQYVLENGNKVIEVQMAKDLL